MDQDKDKDANASRRRDSRASARKVTSLTAEQLERKRANDRDAQRSIRQRTKEHIENLERQVMEMESKVEQYDEVVRRNAALEEEIDRLKHQLAVVTGNERSIAPVGGAILPFHFADSSGQGGDVGGAAGGAAATAAASSFREATSILPSSSQMSQALHDWQHYNPAHLPAPMHHQSSKDYPGSAGQYTLQGQFQPSQLTHQTITPMTVAPHQHAGFNVTASSPYHVHSTDPSMQTWFQYCQAPLNPSSHRQEEGFHRDVSQSYGSADRSMSASTISSENEIKPETVPVHCSRQQLQVQGYHQQQQQQQQQQHRDSTKQPEESGSHEYTYEWNLPN